MSDDTTAGTTPNTGTPAPADAGAPPAQPPEGKEPFSAGAELSQEGQAPEKPADEPAKPVVPEKYDLKMPEGYLLNEPLMEQFSSLAKTKDFTNEDAQAFADLFLEAKKAEQVQFEENWAKTKEEWVKTARKDQEIGGQNYDQSISNANAAFAKFGTPGLKQLLEESFLGSHPEMVRFFSRVGLAGAEGRIISGSESGQPIPPERKLFPNTK